MGYGYGNGVKGDEKPTVIEEGGITQVISKDGATAEQIELEPTFGQKLKNHFRRFCVYVGYPRIAQKGVSGSGLTVNKLNLSEPYSDSCHIELDQVLTVNSPFKPKLFEFAANLSLPGRGHDNPFMRVTVPEAIAQNGQKVNVNQYTDIPVEEFTRYTTTVTLNEEFEVIVYGRPKLQQGKLPKVTVTYNTTTKMKGLNKLKGFALENMTMDLSGAHGKRDDSGSGIMDLLGSFLGGSSNSSSSEDSSSGGDKQGLLVTMAKKMLNFDVPFTAIAAIPNPTVMTLYLVSTTIQILSNNPISL
ncbi:hypothetical protein KEM56_002397 [Ascosphaera pollenicola]|nr:hypothetical protein KEM56_002397 [Ascosphaera pollenicola]